MPKAFTQMPFAKKVTSLHTSERNGHKIGCNTFSCEGQQCCSFIKYFNGTFSGNVSRAMWHKCLSRLHIIWLRNLRLAGKHSIMKHNAFILVITKDYPLRAPMLQSYHDNTREHQPLRLEGKLEQLSPHSEALDIVVKGV
eukprot:sb/3474288/